MDILSMDMSFILKNTGMEERHTTTVFVLRDRLLVSLKLTTTVERPSEWYLQITFRYLFFFKGQPLLLCCMCCKIAIQDFLRGLHKKNKKNLPFPRWIYRRSITRRYFTESCKKITGFYHIHRRISDGFSDVNTNGITDGLSHACLTRVRLREYRQYCRCILPTDHACLTRVRLHLYRRHFRRKIPTTLPMDHACLTRGGIFELFWCAFQLISDGITDRI